MSNGFRKLLLVLAAALIAAAITIYPWTYWDEFTHEASTVYFMSSLVWAPAMLVIGLLAGFLFAFALWPRKPRSPPAKADTDTSIEL